MPARRWARRKDSIVVDAKNTSKGFEVRVHDSGKGIHASGLPVLPLCNLPATKRTDWAWPSSARLSGSVGKASPSRRHSGRGNHESSFASRSEQGVTDRRHIDQSDLVYGFRVAVSQRAKSGDASNLEGRRCVVLPAPCSCGADVKLDFPEIE